MDIKNLSRTEKLAIIAQCNKNIEHYQGSINDIVKDEKGERKLIAARINTIIDREVFTSCDTSIFNDEFLEVFNESLYENSQSNSIDEFSDAIVNDSNIDLDSLQSSNLFCDVFDKTQAAIDEQNLIADNDDKDDDLQIDLSNDNKALALEVQSVFDSMDDTDQLEVLEYYGFHVDIEPMNYFIISDYLADKLRSIGQSVPYLEGVNVMINCAWSLTDNSDIEAIAGGIEYDISLYTDLISDSNNKIDKLRL